MEVAVTGASGLIGRALVARLAARGDRVTILTRDPDAARARHGACAPERSELAFARWQPSGERAPREALAQRDAVVHLAGAPVARRWSEQVKRAIRDSRVLGTRNLVQALSALEADARPRALISASAVGYYGAHGAEPIDEEAPAAGDFLAHVCAEWEAEAQAAERLGLRTAQLRIGVVLDRSDGALARMLTPFRYGLGGPVGNGAQYMAWIHREDLIGIVLSALGDERWAGPVNGTAPDPVTNREFARALGRALHRPAWLPVPALALRLRYGDMAQVITTGVRAMPAKALVLGYSFAHPELEQALSSALG
jgi:uncharacterized protein (TIGR01777 family)